MCVTVKCLLLVAWSEIGLSFSATYSRTPVWMEHFIHHIAHNALHNVGTLLKSISWPTTLFLITCTLRLNKQLDNAVAYRQHIHYTLYIFLAHSISYVLHSYILHRLEIKDG